MLLKSIDISCDMGESFGAYRIGQDESIVKYISSANIACGFHAGDPMVMANTVALCQAHGVAVGAHPGFPDLLGFGRRDMTLTPAEIKNYILYQVGALDAFIMARGLKLQHVKPHGALYNMMLNNRAMAEAVLDAIGLLGDDIICIGLPNCLLQELARSKGIPYAEEFFIDRNLNADGTLVSRSSTNALILDSQTAAARIIKLVQENMVEAIDGTMIQMTTHTLCVHGDSPNNVALAATINEQLQKNQMKITNLRTLLVMDRG